MTVQPTGISDVVAFLALLLSAYAAWTTRNFNREQKKLIYSQEKLNQLLLEKELSGSSTERKADLGATFYKLGSNKHRLKIWNKGKSAARNVRIEFPEGNDILIPSDVDSKFPLEVLEPYQSVELIAAVRMQVKSKHTFRLIWSDEFSETNAKLVYPTL
ncbi:MAG: hypothetical protein EOP06_01125 [Proteobacteria bacterium]|nr:MAG: hypothetical protein EOP06_01125 [Pseudomonadota bacterium]